MKVLRDLEDLTIYDVQDGVAILTGCEAFNMWQDGEEDTKLLARTPSDLLNAPLGPYSRPMPRALRWRQGGCCFL